tara:strand:- start:218 stop:1390 length:1173 start_codon:yes stop_codon:yes gene_type:complete
MATEKGVWNLQEVRDKQIQSEWDYTGNIQLWSWGQGEWIGSPVSPSNVQIVTSPKQISATYGNAWELSKTNGAGGQNVGAIQNGQLWVWGRNQSGQLGQNNKTDAQDPIQVGTDNNWASYATFGSASMAVKTDGTLWAWGYGAQGSLGFNQSSPNTKYSSPKQVGSGTDWSTSSTALAGSLYNATAIKNDGTLWVWGGGGQGRIGDNSQTNRSSPVQVPGTTWAEASTGEGWTMAIKTDGTLWGWGAGSKRGAPGGSKSSPTQVGTDTNWAHVNSGTKGNLAVKTDGTLWSWGYNTHGTLGHGNRTNKTTPVMIGYNWEWSTTYRPLVSYELAGAIKQDGTLWMWGDNEHGEVGQAPNDGYSSPTQVPGTTWEVITGSFESALAQAENHS